MATLDVAPPKVELCHGHYYATQLELLGPGGSPRYWLTVSAEGSHLTTGYKVFFRLLPSVDPKSAPAFSLWHARPTGDTGQMVTPFHESESQEQQSSQKEVIVIDKEGEHRVEVHNVKARG